MGHLRPPTVSPPPLRPLRTHDIARVQQIEREAGQAFREVGLPAIADDDPYDVDELEAYIASGRGWVIEDEPDHPLGYVVVDVLDGAAHVEQVSVDPTASGRRLGRALLDHVAQWARTEGLAGVTLTTFRDVPWNAPYYERLGYRVLAEHELGSELVGRRDHEAFEGLDPRLRVCMRRDL